MRRLDASTRLGAILLATALAAYLAVWGVT
jgi:hypothetical protein